MHGANLGKRLHRRSRHPFWVSGGGAFADAVPCYLTSAMTMGGTCKQATL